MKKNFNLIIDFDSTFIKIEALDALAEIVLQYNPKKEEIVEKIKQITIDGMDGKISFPQSLKTRLKLFQPNKKHIELLIKLLKKQISISIARNKKFFNIYRDSVYIISGGFQDFIVPVCKSFGIPESHILANTFRYNQKGEVTGFDENNCLSQEGGKVKQIQTLNLKGNVYVIGDGFTDYQIKKAGIADVFYIFTENIIREHVVKLADHVLPTFDEFLYIYDLPQTY